MKINVEQIKELRNKTLAGMAACKSALEEAEGDMEKAIDIVKAKGLVNVSNRADRVGTEGRIVFDEVFYLNHTSNITLVEVNCQTDFVANSEGFKSFCAGVATLMAYANLKDFDGDLTKITHHSKSLEDLRKEQCAATGENIVVRRWAVQEAKGENQSQVHYIHSNNKIGVSLIYSVSDSNHKLNDKVKELMGNIAMQIAAMNPIAVSRTDIPQDQIDRQKGIFATQLKEANKPEASWAKIIEGKFNRWFGDNCLLEQESVFVSKKSINTLLVELGKELECEISIVSFARLEVGQGLVKKEENLAEAVALAIN
jgi:elongation factor Ts